VIIPDKYKEVNQRYIGFIHLINYLNHLKIAWGIRSAIVKRLRAMNKKVVFSSNTITYV